VSNRLARIDLARVLLLAATLELVLDRFWPAAAGEQLSPAMAQIGAFSRNLSAVLGVMVLGYMCWLTVRRSDLLGLPVRVLIALVGVVLVPLLGWAALAPMPGWLAAQTEVTFVFLVLACLFAVVRRRGDTRNKLAYFMLTLPLLARGYALLQASLDWLAFGRLDAGPAAEHFGEAAAICAGIAAPVLLTPARAAARLARPIAIVPAAACTIGAGYLMFTRQGLTQELATALGFTLPGQAAGWLLYLVALYGALWLTCGLAGPGPARPVGTGFGLLVVAGYSLARPSELAAIATGLLVISWGLLGEDELGLTAPAVPIDPEQWLADAKSLAQELGCECVIVNDEDRQITRLSGRRGERAVVVRVVRARGLDQVEVVVGAPLGEESVDIQLEERAGAQPTQPFETRYRLRRAGNHALPETAREALSPLGGTTALWLGRGARWQHAYRAPTPLERLPQVVSALASVLAS
jgi:hypothetical protein